jgi:hypothetical protein
VIVVGEARAMSQSHHHSGTPGVSFSWRRALGISALKGRISRKTGIPLTRNGRERKMGHIAVHLVGWLLLALVALVVFEVVSRPALMQFLANLFHRR